MWKALTVAALAALAGTAALADDFQAFPDQRFDPVPKTRFTEVPFWITSVKLTEMPGIPMAPRLEEYRPDYGSRGLVHDVSPRTKIGDTVTLSHDFVVSYGQIQSGILDAGLARLHRWILADPRRLCFICDGVGNRLNRYSDEEVVAMLKARDQGIVRSTEGGSPDGLKTRILGIDGARSYRLEDPGVLYVCAFQMQNGRTLPEPDADAGIDYLNEIQSRYCVTGVLNSNFTSDFVRQRAYRVDFELKAQAESKGPVTLLVQVQVFGVATGAKGSYFTQARGTSPVVTTVVEGDPALTGRYASDVYHFNCRRPLPPQAGRFWTNIEGNRIELYFQDEPEVGAEISRYSGTIRPADGDTLAYRAQGQQWEFAEEDTFPQSAVDQANAAGPHFWTVAGEIDPATNRLRTMFSETLCARQQDGNLTSIERNWRPYEITYH